jgi:predicted dithiol-disulfide oxidoreductase (DUF899 family)
MNKAQERIAKLEAEIFRKQKKLADMRRQLPPEPVENYEFAGPGGLVVTLKQLFGGRDDLILVHNMGAGCRHCTLWADGFNGVLQHIESRAAFVVVSPDKPHAQAEFAASRGWKFTLVSDAETRFTFDMGFAIEQDGETSRTPGFSTFHRTPEGGIFRIASAEFGPGDPYAGIYHLFALLANGDGGWTPDYRYG